MSMAPTTSPPLSKLTQTFILGDSYSDIGWTYPLFPLPTAEVSLGLPIPGEKVSWCGSDFQDNWVVHLSQSRQEASHDMLIYDVARGGAGVCDMRDQVRQVKELLGSQNVTLGENALLGINDVASSHDPQSTSHMAILGTHLDTMFNLGFRHLLLIDVPPRRPVRSSPTLLKTVNANIIRWNTLLPTPLDKWSQKPGTSGRLFSSHVVFNKLLNHPTEHGFEEEDPGRLSGGIWIDGLHPTEAVHEILADEIERFLR